MNDLKTAAQRALKALETNNRAWKNLADSGDAGFWEAEEQPFYETSVKAITALRAALAEPVQGKEHCLWARNGNEPCPHVQQAEPVQEPYCHVYEYDDVSGLGAYWAWEGWKAGVKAEQDRCCGIVFGMAGSDNVAQRTVKAIRSDK